MKNASILFRPASCVLLVATVNLQFAPVVFAQSWGQFKHAAETATKEGNLAEAEKYWKSALSLAADFGVRDPRYCASATGLAAVYRRENRPELAEELYKKMIPDVSKFDASNDEMNSCATDYADFLKQQQRTAEHDSLIARVKVKPVVSLTNVGSVPEKPKSPQSWSELTTAGYRQLKQKDLVAAEQSFRKAAELAATFRETDPRVNQTYLSLSDVYDAEGKFSEAETANQRTLMWILKTDGNRSFEYADALHRHAQLLKKLNRKSDAQAEESRAAQIKLVVAEKQRTFQGQPSGDAFRSITSLGANNQQVRGNPVAYRPPQGNAPVAVAAASPQRNLGRCKAILFMTDWCRYCHEFEPEFAAAANQFGGSMDFEKVDCDQRKDLGDQYQIKSYPTLVYLDGSGNVLYHEGRGGFAERVRELSGSR